MGRIQCDINGGKTLLLGPVYDLTTVNNASVNRKQDVGLLAVWSKSGSFHALKDPTFAAKAFYFLQDPCVATSPPCSWPSFSDSDLAGC